jgi:hypothetical protein
MTSTMVFAPFGPAPGRACGACTLCCKLYALPELGKPPGVWCRHCEPGKGCKVHDSPPTSCRQFFCLWMTDGKLPETWRPDHAKFVLSIFPANGFVYGQVDPGAPAAWRKEPYYAGLRSLARTLLADRRHVVMFVGDEATLVMPDEAIPLGKWSAADQFRIEPGFGPNGPTLRATRVEG